jgi:hypothetical protein
MILYVKASGILESVGGVSPGYWTLTGISGDSTLVRVVGCAPVLGNDVPYLWLTM